jgi:hypothetical protein
MQSIGQRGAGIRGAIPFEKVPGALRVASGLLSTLVWVQFVVAVLMVRSTVMAHTEAGLRVEWPAFVAFVALWLSVLLPCLGPVPTIRGPLTRLVFRCFTAPFHYVTFAQVLATDIMTSASVILFDIALGTCFAATAHEEPAWCSAHLAKVQPYIFALPFWLRFLQCLRRLADERKMEHVVNGGKYLSAIGVVASSAVYDAHPNSQAALYTWVAFLVVKTLYCAAWDVIMDWDLGHPQPPTSADGTASSSSAAADTPLLGSSPDGAAAAFPRGLRPRRLFGNPTVYYVAAVTNLAMRCSWAFGLSVHIDLPPTWGLFMALVEILRRLQWMVYRVENAHLKREARGLNRPSLSITSS